MPWYQDIRFLAALFFGLWGAGLSTYQLFERKRDRVPRVNVFAGMASEWLEEGKQLDYVQVTVTNLGLVDVYFKTGCCLIQLDRRTNGGMTLSQESYDGMPASLKPGDAFTLRMPREREPLLVRQPGKHEFRAHVQDAVSREFVSEWTKDSFLDLTSLNSRVARIEEKR